MNIRYAYTVTGIVQDVGFRYFTVRTARSYGLSGFVANAFDKTVVGEVQGEKSRVDAFVQALERGPASAKVEDVICEEIPCKHGEKDFTVSVPHGKE
ncbi:MAG: acylphosphatase [Fibrobacterota bacterium]